MKEKFNIPWQVEVKWKEANQIPIGEMKRAEAFIQETLKETDDIPDCIATLTFRRVE